ncbi:CPBP family intramembrane metalloprotease [Streptococcus chenjunshii]|uniref:CPBP family intramembrane metalloprotease n=1 Tax=Streptococcus chenjunshii TaxID=2173853 RepID=A0A372KNQ2_9STRE|nr:CPBP family glutamic-type intramembrane protease [Streptococcus chenjunshii]AXQ77930.1 CPBP family intramembrane metalloprotease [Streptococcus chenjunshii]RFU51827.1 CPBP family intramembrane metalloprotease [Streptococcus chenjunshii]RFU53915.1 CPBP family intramembrane metalloprotease [Streptococcus chenjunshii]
MQKEKLKHLKWFDLLALTGIMFGFAIYRSIFQYLVTGNDLKAIQENVTFSSLQNYQALAVQLIWLFFAFMYLLWRNFDFSLWTKQIKLTFWVPLQALAIFALAALTMDFFTVLTWSFFNPAVPSVFDIFGHVDLSLLLYSLMNGFYEEIFFLGICLAVKPNYVKWSFLFSLFIRFSFHTYQGMTTSIGLGFLLGTVFFLLYKKMKKPNLLPFFLAHSIADIIGLSLLFYFN